MRPPASRLVCAGCGAAPSPVDPYPFRCPRAGTDDVDHVLVRVLDLDRVRFPPGPDDGSPFVRYRALLHSHHRARAAGVPDDEYVALAGRLDEAVSRVAGRGFLSTPFGRSTVLSDRLGFRAAGGVWVKDETGNVAGSHKARHLMGVLLHLEVSEQAGLADPARRPDLAVASCGNAALAAAVLARAADAGFLRGYEGIRTARDGRRFRILDATIWTVEDDEGTTIGQAATFERWEDV